MQRLAIYFDVGIDPWTPETPWADLANEKWDSYFQPGISQETSGTDTAPSAYVLQPIDGRLSYLRRGPNVRSSRSQPIQEADVSLESVSLQITSMPHLWQSGMLLLYHNAD